MLGRVVVGMNKVTTNMVVLIQLTRRMFCKIWQNAYTESYLLIPVFAKVKRAQ